MKLHRSFSAPLIACTLVLGGAMIALIAASIDSDSDQMPDAWELFFLAEDVDPGDDLDGDGLTNLAESMAGTDPFDPASYFHVEDLKITDEGVEVTWPTVSGKEYRIEVTSDLQTWNPLEIWYPGDNNDKTIAISSHQRQFATGMIIREWFDLLNASGFQGVDRLLNAPALLANTPDETFVYNTLEYGAFDPDRNRHGSRVRSYFIPPASDFYRFYVSSDDQSDLVLSVDGNPANATVVASVPDWTTSGEWDRFDDQASSWIWLEANSVAYLELRHVDSVGTDHAAVAFETPSLSFRVMPGELLAPYTETNPLLVPEGSLYVRVQVRDRDSDGDGVSDYEELLLGFDPDNPSTNGNGVGDLTAITDALSATNRVSITTIEEFAYESPGIPGRFELKREGSLRPVSISISTSGSATEGDDYLAIPTTVQFPLGARSVIIPIIPNSDALNEGIETVTVEVLETPDYELGLPNSASLQIDDAPPRLLIARPGPVTGAATIGEAIVTMWERGNREGARISVQSTNLSSVPTATFGLVDPVEGGGPSLEALVLPPGNVTEFEWDYLDPFTPDAIRRAIDEGRFRFEIRTANYPAGELSGVVRTQFADGTSFATPAAAPEIETGSSPLDDGSALDDAAIVRFLSQATFGPTEELLAEVKMLGFEAWLDKQMDPAQTPISLHTPPLLVEVPPETPPPNRQDEWFRIVVDNSDQLRQRVAFALSQLFVVSEVGGAIDESEAVANYYDLLVQGAFGSYRQLLEDVSLSPAMGTYLSHLRNPKGDPFRGINPDENYAREIMQLFTIGLKKLHPDGTPVLDTSGEEIPTYTQETITEMARVFTGWSYHSDNPILSNFWWGSTDRMNPMTNFPDFHDNGPKRIVDGLLVPPDLTGPQELALTLDALHNHPNTGPFVCRRLIQRLVTSNPSPGYLYRVAQVFANDGTGVRGNLGAVVKAILLDYEARSSSLIDLPGYGKQHEPLIRFLRSMRLLKASSTSGAYPIFWPERDFFQAAGRSPTVFNFFLPDYAPPGTLTEAGLVAPEFQITSETTTMTTSNEIIDLADGDGLFPWLPADNIAVDWQPLIDLYTNQGSAALIDYLDLYICSGQMPPEMRTELIDLVDNATWTEPLELEQYKVRSAFQVIVNSAQGVIQR